MLKSYTYKSENTLITPFILKKIITLKSIPAKFTRLLNIHRGYLFILKNSFKSSNMHKKPLHTKNLYIKASHTSNMHTNISHKKLL